MDEVTRKMVERRDISLPAMEKALAGNYPAVPI
jgi:hypothetical protein